MSANTNFICYQGFQWARQLQFLACGQGFDLSDYGIDFYVKTKAGGTTLVHLSLGDGITVDLSNSTATMAMNGTATAAISTTGLPTMAVTELLGQECCGECIGPAKVDTKIGPTAICELILTTPSGDPLQPELIGQFLVYPQI